MVCPLCGYGTNPPGARFCAGCGRLSDEAARLTSTSASPEPAGAAAGVGVSPWAHGGVGAPTAGRGSSDRSTSSDHVPRSSMDHRKPAAADGAAIGSTPTVGADAQAQARPHLPPQPPQPNANGRPAGGDPAGFRPRQSADRPPPDAPRRALPQTGEATGPDRWPRSGSAPGEPFALPASIAALASSSRTWAAAAPLSALIAGFMSGIPALFGALGADVGARAGLGGLPAIVGPLLIWQLRQKDDPFSAQHGQNALNFNLTVLTLAFGLTLFTTLTWGIGALVAVPAGIALVVGWLICSAIATSRAWKGQSYRYPLAFRFVRNQ